MGEMSRGFPCPRCGGPSCVTDSRGTPYGVRRRRHCEDKRCGERWTTYEISTGSGEGSLRLGKVIRSIGSVGLKLEQAQAALALAQEAMGTLLKGADDE